jgi:hypothetical protein
MREETVQDWLDSLAMNWGSDECLEFPFSVGSHGYGQVVVNQKRRLAHRYICEKFNGLPPRANMDAAHSCGNKICVNGRHLRWASRSENEGDKKKHGRSNAGQRHGMSKLTADEVATIRNASGFQKDIAERFGISRQHVSDIKGGRRWTSQT